jgi:hypothetical protein
VGGGLLGKEGTNEKKIRKSKEKKMGGISIKKENPRGIQGETRARKRVTQCTTVRFLV